MPDKNAQESPLTESSDKEAKPAPDIDLAGDLEDVLSATGNGHAPSPLEDLTPDSDHAEAGDSADGDDDTGISQDEFDALNDKYMRALAEAQNIRRRADRDMQEMAKFHSTQFARDLLPIYDYLKKALSSIENDSSETVIVVREGIELTLKEFVKALHRHGIGIIAPEPGEAFDSTIHEALLQAPANDVPVGRIASVMTEGFLIHGRLLRPSQVAVSSGPSEVSTAEPTDQDTVSETDG